MPEKRWSDGTNILVVDLDGTLCSPNLDEEDVERRYAQAAPRRDVISAVNRARDRGYYVVIHTARRMVTHRGDAAAAEAEVGALTREWLDRHGVEYDELVFGKPYGRVYVDDRCRLPEEFAKDVMEGRL